MLEIQAFVVKYGGARLGVAVSAVECVHELCKCNELRCAIWFTRCAAASSCERNDNAQENARSSQCAARIFAVCDNQGRCRIADAIVTIAAETRAIVL
jgi:hypothetical protein